MKLNPKMQDPDNDQNRAPPGDENEEMDPELNPEDLQEIIDTENGQMGEGMVTWVFLKK